MTARLTEDLIGELDRELARADRELATRYPGDRVERAPVHTVYVPADRYTADTPTAWGRAALELLDRFAPTADTLAAAVGLAPERVAQVYDRVRAKLDTEPIEDLRVDFEDGYGRRADDVEDADLARVLTAYDAQHADGTRPSWWGIRFKAFEAPNRARGVATLVAFLERACGDGRVPDGLTLTLPKVTSVDQVRAMALALTRVEAALGLPDHALRFEIQVETAQAIMAADGTAAVAAMVHAADRRVTGLVYGTFDYSAGLGVAAQYQSLDHPVADHAKAVMQVAAAQTGVTVSDGSTNVVDFADERAAGASWALHTGLVARSLRQGIYQGWDMCPGHLVSRYLATYLFFRETLHPSAARLAAYVARIDGGIADEPATARMLASALLRGVHCGAVDAAEVSELAGLDLGRLAELTH
ncbi:aldolase/citrate lyase family protein [Allobranchiibius sp. CTAmp26]|uniref:DUF6986 family protein n=1 Tax=Allobranchiibius sp. CTAmp26 TaxID=2815214 RepID=UPI001AA0E354|nr:aldolase/citrate lyase family protein [Allobranchiibius sp. CTAmp26]MBO1756619.1 aldolase [Allobranchiibius sp. CTAmp26]